MLRLILLMAIMFALPFLVWHVIQVVRSTPANDDERPSAPTTVLAIVGAFLAIAALLFYSVLDTEGVSDRGGYQPPRAVDGEIVPGHFEPDDDEVPEDPPQS